MAKSPFYQDPAFLERAKALGRLPQSFGGPFVSTRNAVASRLTGQRYTDLGTQMTGAGAEAGMRQSLFNQGQDWTKWGGQFGRAANQVAFQEQMEWKRRMEEEARKAAKKRKRRGIAGAAIGALGGAAGAFLGGPMGAMAGQQLGSSAGSLF